MRNTILFFVFFIVTSASFSSDLPFQLDRLTSENLPVYKGLLRQFSEQDQKVGLPFRSEADLAVNEREVDELAELGLYDIRTIFTDWLIVQDSKVVGLYSVHIPADEFSLDTGDLFRSLPLPVSVLDRFTYSSKYPFGGGHSIESGYSVASLRLLKDMNSIEVKKAIEEALIRPLCGYVIPLCLFSKGEGFCLLLPNIHL